MELRGKKIVVFGLGKAGRAAVHFLAARGAAVVATDSKNEAELGAALDGLSKPGVQFVLGAHPGEIFDGASAVIVSPGVPLSLGVLEKARKRGLRVVGDVEFAAAFITQPVLAITGTNGKSTVTALAGKMLEADGRGPFVGANLGRPIFEAFDGSAYDSLVLELSSYQIETLETLKPKVAVLLNVTEDHLDRYDSFEAYRETKARLLRLVPKKGTVVVNLDDPACMKSAEGIRARCVGFTLDGAAAPRGWGRIWSDGEVAETSDGEAFDLSKSKLTGRHNLANQLAAIAAVRAFGVSAEAIERSIREFRGLPHRCELVATVRGVTYYDDSKGTNVGAVVESLKGFAGPVVLVAGGIGKHGSYEPLREAARGRVKVALLIGQARDEIAAALEGICPTEKLDSLDAAVDRAADLARAGDTVLLSPACASFDMFRDYAERGEKFQMAVRRLSA